MRIKKRKVSSKIFCQNWKFLQKLIQIVQREADDALDSDSKCKIKYKEIIYWNILFYD